MRRNVIGTDDGTLKGYGIEIIARDVVVTDNVVNRGSHIGLSVSNKPVKNNVFWGYNTVRDCIQFGAQIQGETGGIARHYFYRCTFENGIRGDARARYPNDSGHGFRTNGNCRELVLEDCTFRNNGGYGVQLGGTNVDRLLFLRCAITNNALAAATRPSQYTSLEFRDCTVDGNGSDQLPDAKSFQAAAPVAEFRFPETIHAGDLRWQRPDEPSGFAKVKECILMRTSRDPEYRIAWTAWARKNRIADAMDQKPVDPFDATVTGSWLYRWASGEV